VQLLETAHADAGKLPWKDLFAPAIRIAGDGFRISPRLAFAIDQSAPLLQRDPEARGYFLGLDGLAKPRGTRLANPALAQTFQAIAAGGSAAFYTGAIAQDIVDEVRRHHRRHHPRRDDPGRSRRLPRHQARTGVHDLPRGLGVRHATAVVGGYRRGTDPGHPRALRPGAAQPTTMDGNGAGRRWRASTWSARPSAWPMPTATAMSPTPTSCRSPAAAPRRCSNPAYLQQRAQPIRMTRSLGTASPGDFPTTLGAPPPVPEHGTSQITIVDAAGNVVTMTTTIEQDFGLAAT